jgi:excisionase family DNA binding protein
MAKSATMEAEGAAARERMMEEEALLTPGEVALMFRVDPKTVGRWARQGRLTVVRTPGGNRRYREAEVREYLNGDADATRRP